MEREESGTVYLLKRTELAVRGCIERVLGVFGLTPTQFHLMRLLEQNPGISAAELARSIGLRPQSINDMVGPLVRRGLIVRKPSLHHRRVLETRLSSNGVRLLARAMPAVLALESRLLGALGDAQLAELRRGLEELVVAADADAATAGMQETADTA